MTEQEYKEICAEVQNSGIPKQSQEVIIDALGKQVGYKPKEYEDRYYACKCDNILLPKWKKYNTELMPKTEGLPHCMSCGQKLDWSDDNE